MRRAWWWLVTMALAAACGRSAPPAELPEDELPSFAVSKWSARTELFAEHPALVAGQPARFAIHFTDLQTFEPLREGRSVVRLTGATTREFTTDAPSRPGIFGVSVTPPAAGRYRLRIEVSGPVSDAHDLGEVEVFADEESARRHAAPEEDEGDVSFLKEQQWTLDFATALAEVRAIRAALEVPGEVRPRAGGEAVVAAPVAGRVIRTLATATPGALVPAGAVLVELLPQSGQAHDAPGLEAELAQARTQLQLAEADRARVERLSASGAVPARRVQEALAAEENARARVTAAEGRLAQLDLARTGEGDASRHGRFLVRAPLAGVVTEATVTAGTAVEQSAPLFRLVATDAFHVVAHVPEAEMAGLGPTLEGEMLASPEAEALPLGRPLSRGRVLDASSRTLPVVFRLARPPAHVAVGQRATVRLFTGASRDVVALPSSALVDDGGRPVVFVQKGGESFERRPVRAGARDAHLVEVEGVAAGERVVVRGAPLVRLASLSSQVPAHGHVH